MSAAESDGATVVPEEEAANSECMGRWKHHWQAVWINGVWTDRQVCSTCGTERDEPKL